MNGTYIKALTALGWSIDTAPDGIIRTVKDDQGQLWVRGKKGPRADYACYFEAEGKQYYDLEVALQFCLVGALEDLTRRQLDHIAEALASNPPPSPIVGELLAEPMPAFWEDMP